MKQSKSKTLPNRLWFLARGCRMVPAEFIQNKILWAHPDGYFLNAQGQKLAHAYSPAHRTAGRHCHNGKRGNVYPSTGHFGNKDCHLLMALAFYGPRPTYIDPNGKEYVGIVHHLNGDPLDYRPHNLLCWLTRPQHTIADKRQAALKELYPDLNVFSYADLRDFQDPRVTSDGDFARLIEQFEEVYEQRNGPLFKKFDALYRSTVLRSTRITREERARAKAVWDHMTKYQRSLFLYGPFKYHEICNERMDYTLSSFISHN